jgi:signal transduction histidine kinase
MFRILGCLTDQHEPWLVIVAAIICAFGCFTTFSLLARARHRSGGESDWRWLAVASVTGGATIWTTHFVAMLAYHPGFAAGYDIPLTLLSILFAVSLTWAAFATALRYSAPLGGVLFGIAVGTMHYTGMSALSAPADFHWDPAYVAASLAIGVGLGAAALWLFMRSAAPRRVLCATALLTLAIAGLHFTAMSALTLTLDPMAAMPSEAVMAPSWLAIAIAFVMVMIAGLGLAGSAFDQHLAEREAGEAARLRAYVEQLEAAKAELHKALSEAAAASEAKSRFLAAMSHELRTPLNAIIGFSDIMRRELFGPHGNPRYRDYVADVNDSGNHLLKLINAILDFTKIDSGQLALREEAVDPAEIAERAKRALRGDAERAGLRLRCHCADDLPRLHADGARVEQVLLNLLSNAIKFTPAGGTVTIAARRDGDGAGLVIAVEDTGIGIAAEDMARALEPFAQIDGRLQRKYEGAGLGLPLSRKLMELHGGSLGVDSILGHGTTVTMHFPATRLLPAPAASLRQAA